MDLFYDWEEIARELESQEFSPYPDGTSQRWVELADEIQMDEITPERRAEIERESDARGYVLDCSNPGVWIGQRR